MVEVGGWIAQTTEDFDPGDGCSSPTRNHKSSSEIFFFYLHNVLNLRHVRNITLTKKSIFS